jgi:hypothetical protein
MLALAISWSVSGCIEKHIVRYAISFGCQERGLKVVKDERGLYRVEGCEAARNIVCTSAWSSYACELKSAYAEECAVLARQGQALPPQAFVDNEPSEENPHKAEIRDAIVTQAAGGFFKCFDCALKMFPSDDATRVGGRIDTSISVDETGRVVTGSARSTSIAPELSSCVLGVLAKTQFPKTPFIVRYPVRFEPQP